MDPLKQIVPSGCRPEQAGPLPCAARTIVGRIETPVGPVPRVGTSLQFADHWGRWKARWGIGRMHYRVEPGPYAVGEPNADSPVLVTANYTMTFDRVRSQLDGYDAWIVVLDTRGINVWCAAGKGTFGTDELVGRIEAVGLDRVVSHRRLILPQLGSPGMAAHEVKARSGFRVVYGPVRAEDLPAFLDAPMKATAAMRRVEFPWADRVALIPMELIPALKWTLPLAVCLFFAAGAGSDGYSWSRTMGVGSWSAGLLLGVTVWGAVLTPALLPWLPGRPSALKGFWLGVALYLAVMAGIWGRFEVLSNWPDVAAWALLMPVVASFLAMNFTGASTYTSLSGVRKEMAIAVPLQVCGALAGVTLWVLDRFI